MKRIKEEKGSITLFVLIAMLFFIMFLVGVYMLSANSESTQTEEMARIKEIYEKDINNIDDVYATIAKEIPELWEETQSVETNWYSYAGKKVNAPVLKGNMTAIRYTGEVTGNKWANAITKDGSMWVWIPRYAYKITEGYHDNPAEGGKIEVAFIDMSNNFLNAEDTGEITDDPSAVTYTDDGTGNLVQDQWLVHPAFTANASIGGGFGDTNGISGLWVAKFETSGSITAIAVKPGVSSLRELTINEMYQAGKSATFGETVELQSHMMKNSEWGATVYLAHSKYGTKGVKIAQNTDSSYYTGGSNTATTIYTTNANQSATLNAYGIYDLNGGAFERVASYVNNGDSKLSLYGGTTAGDLYGADATEQETSTAYKTVYSSTVSDESSSQSADYGLNAGVKGDAVYETSNASNSNTGSWFSTYSHFPYLSYPFFGRGGSRNTSYAGTFFFYYVTGEENNSVDGFRTVLIPE